VWGLAGDNNGSLTRLRNGQEKEPGLLSKLKRMQRLSGRLVCQDNYLSHNDAMFRLVTVWLSNAGTSTSSLSPWRPSVWLVPTASTL
jgi:hypothetical protein